MQYPSKLRKQRQELEDCNKQPCRTFLREDLASQIIMDCRTIPAINFETKLGFNQQDPIMTQEQSILTKIKSAFSVESIILQQHVLGYRIDAYFPKYKLAVDVDELEHSTRAIESEIERKKAAEKEVNCKFVRINPAKENFDVGKIQNFSVKSTRKNVIHNISNKFINIKFKSNNNIKTKCLKYIVKKYYLNYNFFTCHFSIVNQNMKTYCLVCKKNTDNVNSKMIRTTNGRLQLKSQCSICGNKKK